MNRRILIRRGNGNSLQIRPYISIGGILECHGLYAVFIGSRDIQIDSVAVPSCGGGHIADNRRGGIRQRGNGKVFRVRALIAVRITDRHTVSVSRIRRKVLDLFAKRLVVSAQTRIISVAVPLFHEEVSEISGRIVRPVKRDGCRARFAGDSADRRGRIVVNRIAVNRLTVRAVSVYVRYQKTDFQSGNGVFSGIQRELCLSAGFHDAPCVPSCSAVRGNFHDDRLNALIVCGGNSKIDGTGQRRAVGWQNANDRRRGFIVRRRSGYGTGFFAFL